MSEYVAVDHARASYSAPLPNPRDSHEQTRDENTESQRVRRAGQDSTDSDRWSDHLNTRVPSRPPGELRSVDE